VITTATPNWKLWNLSSVSQEPAIGHEAQGRVGTHQNALSPSDMVDPNCNTIKPTDQTLFTLFFLTFSVLISVRGWVTPGPCALTVFNEFSVVILLLLLNLSVDF
jgi:hypothetical protein